MDTHTKSFCGFRSLNHFVGFVQYSFSKRRRNFELLLIVKVPVSYLNDGVGYNITFAAC